MDLTYRDLPRFLGREQRILIVECILAAALRQIEDERESMASDAEYVRVALDTAGSALSMLAYQIGGHRYDDPSSREPTGNVGVLRALEPAGGFCEAGLDRPGLVNTRVHADCALYARPIGYR